MLRSLRRHVWLQVRRDHIAELLAFGAHRHLLRAQSTNKATIDTNAKHGHAYAYTRADTWDGPHSDAWLRAWHESRVDKDNLSSYHHYRNE